MAGECMFSLEPTGEIEPPTYGLRISLPALNYSLRN
jgi:hypothetical protein